MSATAAKARVLDALVIGAGPAGLATSRQLTTAGVGHLVVERGERPGQSWRNFYDSLVLHTARRLSALPGLPFSTGTPLFPTRDDFVTYLDQYAASFPMPLRANAEVIDLRRESNTWRASFSCGDQVAARSVVVATGIASNPHQPPLPGRHQFTGRVIHSCTYHRPTAFTGQRVLVVGAGNSAADIAIDLASAGIEVVLAGRRRLAVPLTIAGIPSQYFGFALAPFLGGRKCPRPPIVGAHLDSANAIDRHSELVELTAAGARFDNGVVRSIDTVILATGFRPAIGCLRGLITLDECGFPSRIGRVASADQPDLFFVGHRYDARGALYNIGRDARAAAALVKSTRCETHRTPIGMRQRHYGK